MQGIILGISERKFKRNRNGTGVYRYIAFRSSVENNEQEYLVRMTDTQFQSIPVDKDGNPRTPKSGDIVQIEHYYEGNFVLDDGKRMLFNPKIFTIFDHVQKESTQRYYLEGINFYDWGVTLKNKGSKCVVSKKNWDELTGIETSSLLWKLKRKLKEDIFKEAYIEITTKFRVYYGWRIEREWLYHPSEGFEWRITSENLLTPLKKVVLKEEEVRRTRMLLEEIKTMLQDKMFLSWDDILSLARKFTIPEQDVQEYVRRTVWKKDYDEAYTNVLNKMSTKVMYGHDGLFYVLPGGLTILEVPEPSKATYIFIGAPDFVADKIEAIRRQSIIDGHNPQAWRETLYRLKKATPEKLGWFVGRIYHLDNEQWKRDLNNVLEEIK